MVSKKYRQWHRVNVGLVHLKAVVHGAFPAIPELLSLHALPVCSAPSFPSFINLHHGPFYLLVLFGLAFVNRIFTKTFQTFLEVKVDINQVI